jgi:hypothetical protein
MKTKTNKICGNCHSQSIGYITVTQEDAVFLRLALKEFRTAVPLHIASDPRKLEEWRNDRDMWDDVRTRIEAGITNILADCFDANRQ